MMTAIKNPFPFPLQIGALEWFVHPVAGHPFAEVRWDEGCALVANGYLALRVHRGHWDKTDFAAAGGEFLKRFEALPWARFHGLPDEWRALDEVRGHLFRHAPVSPWTEKGAVAPSRVWRVNGCFLGRLSHLQLIARLPRCEVHLGIMGPDSPLLFRFNGGLGLLAADKKLTGAGFSVFEPGRWEDGTRKGKPLGPCVLPPPAKWWGEKEES